MLKNPLSIVFITAGLAGLVPAPVGAQRAQESRAAPPPADDIQVVPVQGNVYMVVGAGGNIAMQIGEDGVLLVDTGTADAAPRLISAIQRFTDKRVRYVINTHAHPYAVGGNAAIVKAFGGQRTAQGGGGGGVENPDGVQIFAHQKTADGMLDAQPEYPDEAVPKFTFLTEDKQMFLNGEAIDLWWKGEAHTDGDVLVYFRKSDVVVAGDLLQTESYPTFDVDAGGRLQGILNGLNHIIDITVPRFNQMDGTRVIPGHGRLCTESDVAELRDMPTIIRDRIQYMLDKKMTLDQVKAAHPTLDYDPVYGAAEGERFVEAVYADLQKPWKGPKAKSGLNFSDGGR